MRPPGEGRTHLMSSPSTQMSRGDDVGAAGSLTHDRGGDRRRVAGPQVRGAHAVNDLLADDLELGVRGERAGQVAGVECGFSVVPGRRNASSRTSSTSVDPGSRIHPGASFEC
jgi:hypothetical protein